MDVVYEDEGLWDELSHQQIREIEQHRARTGTLQQQSSREQQRQQQNLHHPHSRQQQQQRQQYANGGNMEAVQRVARRAADEVGRFTETVYRTTVTAYQNHQRQSRNSYTSLSSSNNNNNNIKNSSAAWYLDDFGISAGGDDPLLTPLSPGSQDEIITTDDHTNTTTPSTTQKQQTGKNDNNINNHFIVLPRQNRIPPVDGWGAVSNLDLYLSSLYTYYYHRGMVPILGKGLVELVTLFLTLYLSVFLFAHVDWSKLKTCIDETTCQTDFFEAYYIAKPRWTLWHGMVRLYFLIFLAYGIFSLWSFWHTVQDAIKAKRIFEDRLGIPSHKLEGGAVDWDRDVVVKLCQLQESGEYRIAIDDRHHLDALTVAHRILRKENWFVALVNRGLLDLSVPYVGHGLFCPSLEWSLYFCIFNFMFNHKFNVRPAFYLDPSSLKQRFVICGLAHVVFMPFLLLFMLLYFGLRNAYDWKSTKQYLGPREWSLAAKWTFREFNELPHFFERRLAPSYEAAESYLKLFGQNEIMTAVGRILVFLGGSIGIVLLGFAAINDAILLHVKIGDWNLLWYAGMAGIVYSAGKSMLPDNSRPSYIRNIYAERDTALANVAKHTHYYPDIWRGRGWDKLNHKAFSSMFKFKAQNFLHEVLALVLAPYILCVALPRCAEGICEFVLAVKAEVSGAGEVCGYATFDFDVFGDETWEGRTMGNDTSMPQPSLTGSLTSSVITLGIEEATKHFPKPKARHGKMEKSFFSFKGCHPSWKVSESGQHLVDRVEQYQREEMAALTREQHLHIQAAARQLETLARLERQTSVLQARTSPLTTAMTTPAVPLQPIVNESYIPRAQAHADAGAGLFPRNTGGYSSVEVTRGPPPPPAAFSHFTLPRSSSEQRATSNDTEDSDVAPFALDLEPSTMSVSPVLTASRNSTRMLSTEIPPLNRSIPATVGSRSLTLSADMLRLLNMSTLETGSLLDGEASSIQSEERRYMWLERYHQHLAAQQREQEQIAQLPAQSSSGKRECGEAEPGNIV